MLPNARLVRSGVRRAGFAGSVSKAGTPSGQAVVVIAGPYHGQDDESRLSRMLRADPPPEALPWVSSVVGGGSVQGVRPLRGGSSAAMHLVTVRAGDSLQRVVLRRYLRPEQQAERPSCARLEANALEHLAASPVPPRRYSVVIQTAPSPACQPYMTELASQLQWDGQPRTQWANRLAEIAAAIHQIPLPKAGPPVPIAGTASSPTNRPDGGLTEGPGSRPSRSSMARRLPFLNASSTGTSILATCSGNAPA